MEVMFDRVAGLDVGKDSVTVCVRTPGPPSGRCSETRTFKTMFGSLRVDVGRRLHQVLLGRVQLEHGVGAGDAGRDD
jgi:hypothetical protein